MRTNQLGRSRKPIASLMGMPVPLLTGILVLCALLSSGCGETLNEYYVSNHTDTDVTVRLTPVFVETIELASGPLIADLEMSARSYLQQPVSYDLEQGTL